MADAEDNGVEFVGCRVVDKQQPNKDDQSSSSKMLLRSPFEKKRTKRPEDFAGPELDPQTATDTEGPEENRESDSDYDASSDDSQDHPQQKQSPLADSENGEQGKNTRLPRHLEIAREHIVRLRGQIAEKELKLKEQRTKFKHQRTKEDDLHDRIQQLKGQLEESEIKNQEAELRFNRLQAEKLDRLGENEFPPLLDDVVSARLSKIFGAATRFSKKWCFSGWTAMSHSQQTGVASIFAREELAHTATLRAQDALRKQKILPRVLLNALVNYHLCDSILARPFAHLRAPDDKQISSNVNRSLTWVYNMALSNSHEKACRVRATIARALEMPVFSESPSQGAAEHDEFILPLHEQHCLSCCDTLFSEYGSLFKVVGKQEKNSRRKEFLAIVKDAMDLASDTRLHYQHIGPMSLKPLRQEGFTPVHEYYVPHRNMKLKDDEHDLDGRDPEKLGIVGRKIDMIVEPTFFRCGDEDGKNYDIWKVLHQGSIWVVADEDLYPQRTQHGACKEHAQQQPDDHFQQREPSCESLSSTATTSDGSHQEHASATSAQPRAQGHNIDPVRTPPLNQKFNFASSKPKLNGKEDVSGPGGIKTSVQKSNIAASEPAQKHDRRQTSPSASKSTANSENQPRKRKKSQHQQAKIEKGNATNEDGQASKKAKATPDASAKDCGSVITVEVSSANQA